jgi:hypothetical protein
MAKSKSGGTRSYIRGRVGSDVYSVGRDAKGAKQQVVRSLAETVANPQTVAQMRGRMIMSTVMQAVSAMRPIIDHSFDNVPTGQPSISEFISRNYALIKADVAAHPATGNQFSLNEYLEKGIKPGAYIVSSGDAVVPTVWAINSSGNLAFELPEGSVTIAKLKEVSGLGPDDYITLVAFNGQKKFDFVRLRINPALADTTTIKADNIGSVFLQEGTFEVAVELQSNFVALDFSTNMAGGWVQCGGFIISRKTDAGYSHSTCTITDSGTFVFSHNVPADTALPTYPVGSEMFLNGGEL